MTPLAITGIAWFTVCLMAIGCAGSPLARKILLPVLGAGSMLLILLEKGI